MAVVRHVRSCGRGPVPNEGTDPLPQLPFKLLQNNHWLHWCEMLASQVAEFGIRVSEDFPKWVCCGGQTSRRPNLKTVTVFKFHTGGLIPNKTLLEEQS